MLGAGMGGLGSFLERVCFRRHRKERSLLFRSHGTSVHAYAHWQKRAAETTAGCFWMTTRPLAARWMWSNFLLPNLSVWFASPLLARFGTSELSSLPEIELAVKRECFSDICDIQCGVTELLKRVTLQVFQRVLEDVYKTIPALCGFWRGLCWKFVTITSKYIYSLFRNKCNLFISYQTLNARIHLVWTVRLPSLPGLSTMYFFLWRYL